MDTKKFEKLITLYLNEGNEEQARALFHDIIVEKSREIYESMLDMEEGSDVGRLMDEVSMDETGMNEEDEFGGEGDFEDESGLEDEGEEFDDDDLEGDESDLEDMGDMDDADMEDMDDMGDGEGDLEDRVVDIEDKLDQLMAEFEELMGDEGAADDEEMAADDEEGAADDEEMAADDEEGAADDEEEMMESVQLKKVAAPKHGDDGVNSKSVALSKPSVDTRGRGAVNFSGTGGSGRSAPSVKEVPGAGSFANKPVSSSPKLSAVAKPKAGEQPKGRSPVAESKRSATQKPVAKRK